MKSFIYIFIFCLFVVSCDFIIPNRLLVKVNGEDFTKIPVKKAKPLREAIGKVEMFTIVYR